MTTWRSKDARLVPLSGALLLAALFCGCTSQDERLVRAAWNDYQNHSLSQNGAAAANRLSQATFDYYAQARDAALYATREELGKMSLTMQIVAVRLRTQYDADELTKMSGRELCVQALDRGQIGKQVADLGLGEIEVLGNRAEGRMIRQGKTTRLKYQFVKENGVWRIDLTPALEAGDAAFEAARQKSGADPERFVTAVLSKVTGKPLGPEIWEPLRARAPAGAGSTNTSPR